MSTSNPRTDGGDSELDDEQWRELVGGSTGEATVTIDVDMDTLNELAEVYQQIGDDYDESFEVFMMNKADTEIRVTVDGTPVVVDGVSRHGEPL